MIKLQVKTVGAEEVVELSLEHCGQHDGDYYIAHTPGGATDVEHQRIARGAGCLRINGRVTPYYAVHRGNKLHLWLAGRTHEIEIVKRGAKRAGGGQAAAASDTLTAPMPGTILKINIAEGQSFAAHDPLIIMESMKMEMTLSAPHGGNVKAIKCEVGQLVEMGSVLAELASE